MGFFSNFFKNTQKELWQEMTKATQGKLIGDNWWKGYQLQYKRHDCNLCLEITYPSRYNTPYTSLRTSFSATDHFHFTIYRELHHGTVGEFLNGQDIQIKNKKFDDHFIVKSNQPERITAILNDPELISLFLGIQDITVKLSQQDQHRMKLEAYCPYEIKDKNEFLWFVDLFGKLLGDCVKIEL